MTDAAAAPGPMRVRVSSRRRGQLAVAVAAVAWSTAGLLQRSLDVSPATQVAGRAAFAAFALLGLVILLERRRTVTAFLSMRRAEAAVAVCTAVASGTFMFALNHTTVANLIFMQALAPLLAALIARVALGEAISARTWSATVIALAGVALMVGGPGSSSLSGHLLALLMTGSFAIGIVIVRHRRDISMAPATCVSQVLVVAAVAPLAEASAASGRDTLMLAALGVGQIGVGLGLLTIGARLLPAAEVALITLLEIVLAPLWVWLAYSEQPGAATLVGGAVVLVAVAVQAGGDLREKLPRQPVHP